MKLPPAGLAIEQPPESLPADAREYLQRVLIQVSGKFENMEKEISNLTERVKVLEGT